MRKIAFILIALFMTDCAYAQPEKFDIATFIPPQNWERTDSNGMVSFMDIKNTAFCQIVLYPSWASKNTPAKNFQQDWNRLIVKTTGTKVKPTIQTEKNPDGWIVVTGFATLSVSGVDYACILATISGFGKAMSVRVNTAGSDYTSIIEKFFNDLDVDSKGTAAANQPNNSSNNNQLPMSGTITLNDYDFIAPQGWQTQKQADHLLIKNMQSGCTIWIFSPQTSSGDIAQDAQGVFDMMYKGWQYQKTGEQKYTISKGHLPKGLEFCMIEAGMSKLSADGSRYDGFENGAALVIKAGAQIAIIAVRHSDLLAHNDCDRRYESWRRFFNSFTVKNVAIPKKDEDAAQRIIGDWLMSESSAIAEYVFAANGNYAFYGALASTSTSRDYNYEYLHIKTYGFKGDGSYSIAGNQLIFKKYGAASAEQSRFRLEKVNLGGTGWKDRLWMLSVLIDGTENEVYYEKKVK